MNICVFDTETTGLDKPYCYNIGYLIADADSGTVLCKRDFVVEQIWHNLALFNTAYYADKRPLYVSAMRSHKTAMEKFGYITQQMVRDFRFYNVVGAYAYNSNFDERVFNFNCDWFKCINPFDNVPIFDIRGYAHHFIVNDTFKNWCEQTNSFSESGNYSTTAETMFRYISKNMDFNEEHTALSDSEIEHEILCQAVLMGAELGTDYKAMRSIERKQECEFVVKKDKQVVFRSTCAGYVVSKKRNTITLK